MLIQAKWQRGVKAIRFIFTNEVIARGVAAFHGAVGDCISDAECRYDFARRKYLNLELAASDRRKALL